jgi:hypothetical protein
MKSRRSDYILRITANSKIIRYIMLGNYIIYNRKLAQTTEQFIIGCEYVSVYVCRVVKY